MTARRIREQLVALVAVVAMAALGFGIAFYILREQRLRMPWDDVYTVRAEFSSAQGLRPGQGHAVTVAGVRVGEVQRVRLRDGRALVDLTIERDRLPAVHRDATMLMRPRTPLQDMTIDVDPGTADAPVLGEDDVLGVERTTPSVNLDEVLATLDEDTRDYASILVHGAGRGLEDRGDALRSAFRAAAPTLETTRRVTAALSARRRELARAMASLRKLTEAVAREDDSVGDLVSAADATFGALGAEDEALSAAFKRLPGTLSAARSALDEAVPFARAAGPGLEALLPAARRLPGALDAADGLVREGLPALRGLRSLSTEGRPLARDLRTAAADLGAATPPLRESFGALRELTNLLAYNPPGEREEGYLFWLAWFAHNMNSFLSTQDANGPMWRGTAMISCTSGANNPFVAPVLGASLESLGICPTAPEGG